MVLGLEVGRDIVPETQTGLIQDETPVRQSRRIAQLKIKEEADRRRIEEETSNERKDKKDSVERKKRKKPKVYFFILLNCTVDINISYNYRNFSLKAKRKSQ